MVGATAEACPPEVDTHVSGGVDVHVSRVCVIAVSIGAHTCL